MRLRMRFGAAVLLAAAGCRGGSSSARRGPAAPAAVTTALAMPVVSEGTVIRASGTVPTAIAGIARHGESVYRMVAVGDWAGARAAADSFQPMLDSIPAAPTIAARELRRTIASEDRGAALRAANRLTQLGALLSAPYHPAIPVEVMLLAFDGRELEIWAVAGDLTRLRETGSAIRCNWNAARRSVHARNGIAAAAKFDTVVAEVGRAATAAEYARLALSVIGGAHMLEQVFAR